MKTRKRTSLWNCHGMSLTESLVGVALLSIVFSGTAILSQNISSMKEKVLKNKSTIYISNSLRMVLENPEAWKNTVLESENEILDCLREKKTCSRQNDKSDRQVRYIRLASNDIFFKSNSHGFTLKGERCNLSDPACAVKPSILATFICNKSSSTDYPISSDCLSPQIELSVKFVKNPYSDIDGNFSQFNFILIKNTEPTPCTFGCREVTYSWDNDANLRRPRLKLVMVIDNSASMNIAQAKLANGFSKMLEELADMVTKLKSEIEFDIYTTTIWDYDAPRNLSVDGVAYSYNYMDSSGNLHTTTTSPSNITHTFDMIQNYYVNWPISISNWDTIPSISNSSAPVEPLILTPTIALDRSEDGKFEIFKKKVQTLVSKIGTSGNAREGGLCVLNKVTYNKGDSRIFNPGDKAIFLVMSNENDFSHTEYCHGYKLEPYIADPKKVVGCNPYTEDNCEYVLYTVKISEADLDAAGVSNRTPLLNFQCSLGNDNVNLVSASYQYNSWGSCDWGGSIACNNTDKTTADTVCKQKSKSGFHVPGTCRSSCAQSPYTCYYKETQDMEGDFCSKLANSTTRLYKNCIGEKFGPVPSDQITCNSFAARAGAMADLANVKKSSYHLEQPEGFAPPGTYELSELLSRQGYFGGGTQSLDPVGLRLSASFLKKAEELFGPPGVGFFVSSIIHDNLLDQPYAASCPKPAARTDLFLDPMGIRYRELAKSSLGSYQSICATDNYADSLTRATDFSFSTLNRSVTIIEDKIDPLSQLSPMEQIIGVWVNGEEQTIGTDVFVNGPTLQFRKNISKNNKVKVRIERKRSDSSNFENVRFVNKKEKSEEHEKYLKRLIRKLITNDSQKLTHSEKKSPGAHDD